MAAFLDNPNQYAGVNYSPALPNDAATVQNGIVARLQAMFGAAGTLSAFSNISVDAFPDDPETWRPLNQVGQVLVRYDGSTYGPIEDVGVVVQQRKLKYRIGVVARGLGWQDAAGVSAQGAYAILGACLIALLGYKVPGTQEMIYAERDEFVRRDRQGGIWIYALDIVVTTWIVATPDPEVIANLLQGGFNVSADAPAVLPGEAALAQVNPETASTTGQP
jgi:hypothetical protein